MKKYCIYLSALLATLSCIKEGPKEVIPAPETIGSIVFTAEVENDDTKTYFGEEDGKNTSLWKVDDAIAIFMGGGNRYQFITKDSGSAHAEFKGPVPDGEVVRGNNANVAVYPFTIAGENVTKVGERYEVPVTLPQTQVYAQDSFGPGAFPMVAVSQNKDDDHLFFRNFCGILKLQLKGDNIPVQSISIKGNNHEKLCGAAVVSAKNGADPTLAFSGSAQEEVVLDCSAANVVLTSEAKAFYIVVPSVTFTNGFTITITSKWNTVFEKFTQVKVPINRSKIRPISAFEVIAAPVYPENNGKGIPVLGNWDQDSNTPDTYLFWAPVNCGYEASGDVNSDNDHRLGKLYQWGAGDASLPYVYEGSPAVAREMYYDTPVSELTPWYNATIIKGSASDKWNNNQGPCPDGWRLPTKQEFSVLCAGKNGDYGWVSEGTYAGQFNTYPGAEFFGANDKTAGNGVFFPAAGRRNNEDDKTGNLDGDAKDRAISAGYWASNPTTASDESTKNMAQGTGAYYLYFNDHFLNPGDYYYRARGYAVRCVSGDGDPNGEPPTVVLTTTIVSEINNKTAVCGGEIITLKGGAKEVEERGVCYSTSSAPTVEDSEVQAAAAGTGSFTCNLTGLNPNTTYYVRAYAVNSNGTYYGNTQSFKTAATPKYIENGVDRGAGIAVKGNWKGTGEQTLYWAPVNCGYEETGAVNTNSDHRLGKLYQWGAGDASLPYYDNETKVVAREMYYDTPVSELTPWYNATIIKGSASDKWKNNQGPCPDGWRLPTKQEFSVLCAGKIGDYGWVSEGTYAGQFNTYPGAEFFGANDKTAGTGVFFPAAGCRAPEDGHAYGRGDTGAGGYWTSEPTTASDETAKSMAQGTGAYYLYFNKNSLNRGDYYLRARAYAVRCVAEQ